MRRIVITVVGLFAAATVLIAVSVERAWERIKV